MKVIHIQLAEDVTDDEAIAIAHATQFHDAVEQVQILGLAEYSTPRPAGLIDPDVMQAIKAKAKEMKGE